MGTKAAVRSCVSETCDVGENSNTERSEVKQFRFYFDDGGKIC